MGTVTLLLDLTSVSGRGILSRDYTLIIATNPSFGTATLVADLKGIRREAGDVVVGQVEFSEQRQVAESLGLEGLDLVVTE